MNRTADSTGIRTSHSTSSEPARKVTAALVFVASAISILFSLLNYPVIGHDAYVHLNWLYQFPLLFSEGIAYPRWLPGSFGGFGAPTFYFYAPLVYWLAGLFHLIGIHFPAILYDATQRSFAVLSLATSYWLLRQYGGTKLRAFVGACMYSFLAYRFCDVYIRNALTEHAALAFLPLVFLQFKDRLASIAVLTLGWAGLFLTNLPTAYLAVLTVIVTIGTRRTPGLIASQATAFVLAIAVASVYLFPAFALRDLIHQRHLFDLDMHTSQFGFVWLDLFHGHFDWLRILSIATLIAGLLLLVFRFFRRQQWERSQLSNWIWVLAIAIFFQLPIVSVPFWHLIPGMPFVQFSWRWNGILLLAITILCCTQGGTATATRSSLRNSILIGLALVTLASELTISRNLFRRPPLPINSYLMDAPEYATKWASNDPSEVIGITLRRMSDPPAVLLGLTAPADSIYLLSRTPTEWRFEANVSQPTPVRFHMFYWPYWEAFIGSAPRRVTPDPNGFMTVLLPPGHLEVMLHLVPAPSQLVGRCVSTTGFLVFVVLCALAGYRSITTRRETTSPPELTRSV